MNIVQEDILKRLVLQFKETGVNSFDASVFNPVENACLRELQAMGYVSISPDILQTVSLSDEIVSRISKK